MKVFIALACLAAVASAGLVTKKSLAVRTTCGPDETECPAGCCPEANWFCCPDNRYCAATADDCPAIKLPSLLLKKVAKTEDCPSGVECPSGCCPYTGWYCCPDNRNCAATPDDCPDIRFPNLLPKKLSVVKTTCGPDETDCFVWCCPHANWFCCPPETYSICAATADDCLAKKFPTFPRKLSVVKTTCGPEQIECPAGCCDLG